MGVIVTKNDNESKLQQRITADLRNRVQNERAGEDPDFVEGADYMKNLKKTKKTRNFYFISKRLNHYCYKFGIQHNFVYFIIYYS